MKVSERQRSTLERERSRLSVIEAIERAAFAVADFNGETVGPLSEEHHELVIVADELDNLARRVERAGK